MRVWLVPAAAWLLCDLLVGKTVLDGGVDELPRLIVTGQFVALLAFVSVLFLGRLVVGWANATGLALTLAAMAAMPIPARWDDGECLSGTGVTHAALVPLVHASYGDIPPFLYGESDTVVTCAEIAAPPLAPIPPRAPHR